MDVFGFTGEQHGAIEKSYRIHLSQSTGGATEWLAKKVRKQDCER